MDARPKNPLLYQLSTRGWLYRLASTGKLITLDAVPDAELDRLAALGIHFLWLLGVWQTGEAGPQLSRSTAAWQPSYREALPDFEDGDITGSPFAITHYRVHADFGGDAALAQLRERLAGRGIRLMLDFVPNHTAVDHPWTYEHPDFYIVRPPGAEGAYRADTCEGPRWLAHGRDPYFPPWSDTLQLNYGNPALQQEMIAQLRHVATLCDGARCDMSMLLLPDVFASTWGVLIEPFWPKAISALRAVHPGFTLLAEVYWDREYELQQAGFDFTYDKRLYDRLLARDVAAVRGHLTAAPDYQQHSARFLENHDEERAAVVFPEAVHRAAAILTFLVPGMRFLHDGQLEGWRLRPSVHLRRQNQEKEDSSLKAFYQYLLALLRQPAVQTEWRLLATSSERVIAFCWSSAAARTLVIAVNYSDAPAEASLDLPFPQQPFEEWTETSSGHGKHPLQQPFKLSLPAWQYRVLRSLD